MKKISVLAMLTVLPVASALAGSGVNSNMKNSNNMMQQNQPTYWSVTEVVSLPDNTPVTMRGKITKNMGDNIYVFEDSSGTIMMEIEEEDWNGNTVLVDDIVTVYGNIDKSDNYTEIDVSSVER